MKYKVGDKVTLTNGNIMTIDQIDDISKWYRMKEDPWNCYTDDMIEGLVEEETKKEDVAWMYDGKLVAERFSDGIVIKQPKYNKLSINTELCDDKVELVISPDFELKQEGDKWFAIKKKKEYPKTYEECCKVLGLPICGGIALIGNWGIENSYIKQHLETLRVLSKLLICRDAYWKIAGEEMGLGKPWESNPSNVEQHRYAIYNYEGTIAKNDFWQTGVNAILSFPTEEMQDAFYENFKKEIEICKELL